MTGLSTSNTTKAFQIKGNIKTCMLDLRISMMNCSDFQEILIVHVRSVHISWTFRFNSLQRT